MAATAAGRGNGREPFIEAVISWLRDTLDGSPRSEAALQLLIALVRRASNCVGAHTSLFQQLALVEADLREVERLGLRLEAARGRPQMRAADVVLARWSPRVALKKAAQAADEALRSGGEPDWLWLPGLVIAHLETEVRHAEAH